MICQEDFWEPAKTLTATLNRGCANEQYRNLALVPDGGDRAAVQQILKETMAVRGHRNQIALFLLSGPENFGGWITQRQVDPDLQPHRAECRRVLLEVGAIGLHLFGLRQLQV